MGYDIATLGAAPVSFAMNELLHGQQVRHQQDFTDQQVAANKELTNYAAQKSLDMWNKTNYEAQMKHIKSAGLNAGLLYGTSGSGGTTSIGNAGNASSNTASKADIGMGLQLASQLELLNAQKENIEADTQLKLKNVEKGTAEITNLESLSDFNKANTNYTEAKTTLTEYQSSIAKIESEITNESKSLRLGTMNAQFNYLVSQTNLNDAEIKEIGAKVVELNSRNMLNATLAKLNIANAELIKKEVGAFTQKLYWEKLNTYSTVNLKETEELLNKALKDKFVSEKDRNEWLNQKDEMNLIIQSVFNPLNFVLPKLIK